MIAAHAALDSYGEMAARLPVVNEAESTTVEVHTEIKRIAGQWDDLAQSIGASPFLRPAWVSAWWRACGRGQLIFFAVREGQRLTAVLPMARSVGRLHSPTNWHTPHFAALAWDQPAREHLVRAVFGRPETYAGLGYLHRAPEAEAAERAALASGRLVHCRRLALSPYVDTTGGEDAYLKTLPARRRKDLRRQQRRLTAAGKVEYEIARPIPRHQVDASLDEAFRVEASGWKGHGGTAITSRARTEWFYREIARWAAEQGWLRLSFLRLEGHAIACDLSLHYDGTCYSLKAGYDVTAAKYGPGILLLHELVLWAHSADLTTIELLGDEEGYKRDWAAGNRELVLVQGFSQSPAGRLAFAASARGRPAMKAARSAVRRWTASA